MPTYIYLFEAISYTFISRNEVVSCTFAKYEQSKKHKKLLLPLLKVDSTWFLFDKCCNKNKSKCSSRKVFHFSQSFYIEHHKWNRKRSMRSKIHKRHFFLLYTYSKKTNAFCVGWFEFRHILAYNSNKSPLRQRSLYKVNIDYVYDSLP